uniref:Uncharacterized protein n=1 Tax=Oryza brachyantha TaxID=4533 RepID=J3MI94_ORYBR
MFPFSKQHDNTTLSSSSPPPPTIYTSPPPPSPSHHSTSISPFTSPRSHAYDAELIAKRMGLCLSSGVAAAAAEAGMSTAMVLLPTGEMREYPRPATAARVLEDVAAAGEEGCHFLCDADAMGFEGPVSAKRMETKRKM